MKMREKIKLLEARVKELEEQNNHLLNQRMRGHWDPFPQMYEIEMKIGKNSFDIVVHRVYKVFKARIDVWTKQSYDFNI